MSSKLSIATTVVASCACMLALAQNPTPSLDATVVCQDGKFVGMLIQIDSETKTGVYSALFGTDVCTGKPDTLPTPKIPKSKASPKEKQVPDSNVKKYNTGA